jgi:hypothetical protein
MVYIEPYGNIQFIDRNLEVRESTCEDLKQITEIY